MMPQQMMPAANPDPERLDETQVKTIQAKVDNKLDPAMPVRTRMPSRAVACGPRAQHEPRRQMNDMPQSEPAGQEQMASVQQARRLGPFPIASIVWSRTPSLEQFTMGLRQKVATAQQAR